jgi:predicted nucleic acid-binding protein
MIDSKLVCDSNVNLVFDNDCLASFIWINRLDILELLYEGRMYVPQLVVDEMSFLKRFSKHKWVYENLLDAIDKGIFKVITINVNDTAFMEYNKLRKQGKGKGESAAIAIAKTMDNYTACNNLSDIRPFVESGAINNLLTFDILYEYYKKEGKSINDIEKIITDMRSKKRNLPDTTFKEYVRERERGSYFFNN